MDLRVKVIWWVVTIISEKYFPWWVGELRVIKIKKISYTVFLVTIIFVLYSYFRESNSYWFAAISVSSRPTVFRGVEFAPDWESYFINLCFWWKPFSSYVLLFFLYKSPLANQVIVEGALKDSVVNFATQLSATCPRVTENLVDINGIPNQEAQRVDVAWRTFYFSVGACLANIVVALDCVVLSIL